MRQIALLVDDDQAPRAFVSAVLRQGGYEVVEAANGTDALSIVRRMRGTVDVLVTDINMPRMTGIELVRAVKADFPAIPVVYISGEALREELHNPPSREVFLQKPFGSPAILDAVRTVIEPAHATSQSCSG
jgi:two-component system, cell cycle sensor histidine kinase and response regulator CckA